MRYPADHKDRVRGKIVRAASRRFRGKGGEVAIADLMRDLKLTHGGFYRHFAGKEELFTEAFLASVEQAKERITGAIRGAPPGRELEAIVNMYLSPGHCAHPAEGCPVAALAGEIARHPKSTRATFDGALRAYADAVGPFMPGDTAAKRERRAIVLLAGMAGTLNLARATADDALRNTILDQARRFYVQAFGRRS